MKKEISVMQLHCGFVLAFFGAAACACKPDAPKGEATIWMPESAAIARVEYFPNSPERLLVVVFHREGGRISDIYTHRDVPESLFEEWKRAPSAGQWYNQRLKGNPAYFFSP